jgi:hypothetical protein
MNEHDDFTSLLTQSLTDHSDTMAGSHLGLAEVKGKARSIRRRRATGAVVAVAAAVAIVVPTIDLAGHTGGRPEPAPATQVPTPTQTANVDSGHQPKPGVLDVSDLPTGAAPRTEYVTEGRTLHLPDGGAVELPTRYPVTSFVVLSDGGHLFLTTHQGVPYVEVENGEGGFSDPVRSGWGLAVNAAHTIGAWLDVDGRVHVLEAGKDQPSTLGDPVPGSDLRVGPISGEKCSLACSVVVNVPGPNGWQPWEVTEASTQELRDGGYQVVDDISGNGLSIGRTQLTDGGSCSKLLGGGEFAGFSTCKNQFSGFSLDGQLLLGEPPYYDGVGPSGIAMYDLTGKRLFERAATAKVQSYYAAPAVWEDDTHALAAVFQDGSWALVRFGTDGSMEYAVPPVKGAYDQCPYVLAAS